ncbi:hypothetical protein BKA80DRAFT_11176 [Phyllosticta citrichinensis]
MRISKGFYCCTLSTPFVPGIVSFSDRFLHRSGSGDTSKWSTTEIGDGDIPMLASRSLVGSAPLLLVLFGCCQASPLRDVYRIVSLGPHSAQHLPAPGPMIASVIDCCFCSLMLVLFHPVDHVLEWSVMKFCKHRWKPEVAERPKTSFRWAEEVPVEAEISFARRWQQ